MNYFNNYTSENLTQGKEFIKDKNKVALKNDIINNNYNNSIEDWLIGSGSNDTIEKFDTYSSSVNKSNYLLEKSNATQIKMDEETPNRKELKNKITNLEKLDSDIIKQIDVNKGVMNNMLQKYHSYNSGVSNLEGNNSEYQNIFDDSKIVVSQKHYSFVLWTTVAIITSAITVYIINPRKP
jgi:hypothetical protein